MAMRIVAGGRRMNRIAQRGQQLASAAAGVVAVGAVDALFPLANLIDGIGSKPLRWAANAGGEGVTWDVALALNGDFETVFSGGLPAATGGWAKDPAATLTRNTTAQRTGVGALQVAGATTDRAYIDIICSPGDRIQIEAAARKLTAGSGNAAKVEVQNLASGKWYNGAAWQTSETTILSNATTSYTTVLLQLQVELFQQCQALDVPIRIYFFAGGGTPGTHDALYDDFQVIPGTDAVCVVGGGVSYTNTTISPGVITSGLAPGSLMEVRTGTDGITYATVVATMAPKWPNFYSLFTINYARYWKLLLSAAQPVPVGASSLFPFVGELVAGQTLTMADGISGDVEVEMSDPQEISASRYGEVRSTILTAGPRYNIGMKFLWTAATKLQEARDQVFRLSRNGAYPFVLIYEDSDPDAMVLGAPAETDFKASRKMLEWAYGAWQMIGTPAPQFIP